MINQLESWELRLHVNLFDHFRLKLVKGGGKKKKIFKKKIEKKKKYF